MRALFAALIFCALSLPAHASWLMPQVAEHHYARHHYATHWHARRHYARREVRYARRSVRPIASALSGLNASVRDALYWLATRQGGPCGLTVERLVFGRSDHVLNGWNPWLAAEWLRFPKAPPERGMVAVWRNRRHVEVVARNNGDGTIATRGSVGFPRVSLRVVFIVNPHADRMRRYAGL